VQNRWVFGAGLVAWTIATLVAWLSRVPLGHDESQYAIAAADLIAGGPQRWLYVSQGTALLGIPGTLAGGSELAIRFVPALLSFAFVLGAAKLARDVTTPTTAAWIVGVLAASLGIVRRSTVLLSDMPAAAALLIGTALLVTEVTREDGPRWRVVHVAPVFAAAFYIRYGSALPIAIVGIVCAIGGWRGVAKHPARIAATLALFVLLLVPHMIVAQSTTGSPLGLLALSTTTITERTTGSGLVGYLTANPLRWYGLVTTPLLLLGTFSIAQLRERRLVMIWVIAIATVIALGITALAQARYLYFSLVLLAMLGIEVVRRVATKRLAIACALAVLVSWGLAVRTIARSARPSPTVAFVMTAAARIEADAHGRPCRLYSSVMQAMWYGRRCPPTYQVLPEHLGEAHTYVIVTPGVDAAAFPGNHVVLHEDRGLMLLRLDPR